MAGELKDARVVLLQNCGHWLTLERPFEVSSALSEFLAA
jgi:pimeloyl-ACP methyl ester carboxylesterase